MSRIWVAVTVGILVVGGASAATADDSNGRGPEARPCPAASQGRIPVARLAGLAVDAVDCRLVGSVAVFEGVGVVIPEPGAEATIIAETGEAGATTLTVATDLEGTIEAIGFVEVATEPASDGSVAGGAPTNLDTACTTSSYTELSQQWANATTVTYYVNTTSGRPSNITSDVWLTRAKAAATNVSKGYNDCGIAEIRARGVTLSYGGTTTRLSNVNGTAVPTTCPGGDGVNVVSFGNISDSNILAVACSYSKTVAGLPYKRTTEVDIRLDNSNRSWTLTIPGCTGAKYGPQSVLTHEFGHFFGLGHVTEVGGNDLTMSPTISSCSGAASTLGKGDVNGLALVK